MLSGVVECKDSDILQKKCVWVNAVIDINII